MKGSEDRAGPGVLGSNYSTPGDIQPRFLQPETHRLDMVWRLGIDLSLQFNSILSEAHCGNTSRELLRYLLEGLSSRT